MAPTIIPASGSSPELISYVLDVVSGADPDDVPGLTLALEAILSSDATPAAEIVEHVRSRETERDLDACAQEYLRETMTRRLEQLPAEHVRALVAMLYPAASPGQDGWTSWLTDYAPAEAIRTRDQRATRPSAADLQRRLEELRHDAMLFDCNAMGAGVLEDLGDAFSAVRSALYNLRVWTEGDQEETTRWNERVRRLETESGGRRGETR